MKIKWNQYTWYSKLAAVIFFMAILPMWTFFVGAQYQKTVDTFEYAELADRLAPQNKGKNTQRLASVELSGKYEFTEVYPTDPTQGPNFFTGYKLNLVRDHEGYIAYLEIDGHMQYERIMASGYERDGKLQFVFDSYTAADSLKRFVSGEKLFTLEPQTDGSLKIGWQKMQPNLETTNKNESFFTKAK